MNFVNNLSKNITDQENDMGYGALIETDAVPIEPILKDSEICVPRDVTGPITRESSHPAAFFNTNGLVKNRDNEASTVNVHSTNQQLVMQISNVNSLHLGSVYNINNELNSENNYRDKPSSKHKANKDTGNMCKKTTTIDLMMKSRDEPSRKMLDSVATHLGSGWKEVMRELGYSEGQISTSELDNHIHGTKEIVYQLLLDWNRNAEEEFRNIGYLTKILWNCGHRECVYRMKLTWKNELDTKNMKNLL